MITIERAIADYIDIVKLGHSEHTTRTYANALSALCNTLKDHGKDPTLTNIQDLSEEDIAWLIAYLTNLSPSTEELYLTAVAGFYEFVSGGRLADINLPRMRSLIRQRVKRPESRLPKYPSKDIEQLLAYFSSSSNHENSQQDNKISTNEELRWLRDAAFLLTLADTGLKVHEACALYRGNIDWINNRAIVSGQNSRQSVVRLSSRVSNALNNYLSARSIIDNNTDCPLTTLPLFARHDKGAGRKIKSITTTTGRNIVAERVEQILGKDFVGKITPHSFRHYFVTTVLRSTHDIKLAQELARHKNIQVTQRYAHLSDEELDKGYYEIFENKDSK
jgi:site-specific recombinase XerD